MLTILLSFAAAAQEPPARRLLPADRDAPGCALDVRRDGKIIEAAATGAANLEDRTPINPETVFEIGSVSKQFIGAGLAILADRGRLSLDDPIPKWLPELPPLYGGVTISMLAHHTSGIRNWNNLAELSGVGEDSTGYDNAWVLRAVSRQRRLNNAPGADYLYSNSNFVLAAIIVERASGQRLNDFFRDALFARLGMTRTRWRTDFREIVPGRAQAYAPNGRGGWRLDMPFNDVAGAGGLLSTVGDLQRWNAMLAKPTPGDRAWVTMLERPGRLSDGTTLRYGMGLETDPVSGIAAFSHAGSTASYRAWLGRLPAQRLSVALLCNSGVVNTEDLGQEVAALFLPASNPGLAQSPVPVAVSVPEDLAGKYRNLANDASVEANVDSSGLHLNGGVGFGLNPAGRLATADSKRTITVKRDGRGALISLSVTRIGNSPIVLVPVPAWRPLEPELLQLVGRYTTPEIMGVQHIEIKGRELIWRDPSGATHPLVPAYRDAFEAPGTAWTLRFRRARDGAPAAVDFSITRARKIRFFRGSPNSRTKSAAD